MTPVEYQKFTHKYTINPEFKLEREAMLKSLTVEIKKYKNLPVEEKVFILSIIRHKVIEGKV